MRSLLLLAALPFAATLGGCVSDPTQVVASTPALGGAEMVYVRADGKRLSTNPALSAQLEMDKAVCRAEGEKFGLDAGNTIDTEKRNLAVSLINAGIKESKIETVMKGCMAQHGYVYLTVAQAEARADALATGGKKRKKHA